MTPDPILLFLNYFMSFQLPPQALAYILSILRAKSIIGLTDARIFPETAEAYLATLSQGYQQLLDQGYLRPDATRDNHYQLDESLLLLVADVAQPDFVVLTEMQPLQQPAKVGLHYVAAQDIVELSSTADGRYEIGRIDTLAQWVTRLAEFIGLPKQIGLAHESFMADVQWLENARQGKRVGLQEIPHHPATDLSVQSFLQCGQSLVAHGQLTVVWANATAPKGVLKGRIIDIFVGPDAAWLARRVSHATDAVVFEHLNGSRLSEILTGDQFLARVGAGA